MPNNFPNLFETLPQINATVNILSAQGLTKDGLINVVFPNAEELFNTKFWPKFIESYSMKSPISMFKGLNVKYVPELKNVLPSPLPFKGTGHSR